MKKLLTKPGDKPKTCFFIAPIGEEGSEVRRRSDQVLKHIVREAAKECGYKTIRADEISEPGIITSQVLEHVIEDPLVIADLTGRNPNVYYELALRHASKKPVVQIIDSKEDLPFDVSATRVISFDCDLDGAAKARKDIVQAIRSAEENPDRFSTPITRTLELQDLRQSGNLLEKSNAEIITMFQDMRSSIIEIRDQTRSQHVNPKTMEQLSAILSDQQKLSEKQISENEFLQKAFDRLRSYTTLFNRVDENKTLKIELARFFWSHCFSGIVGSKQDINQLFFESGSTVAYVASEFYNQAMRDLDWKKAFLSKLRITTNNLLVFIQYLFTPLASLLELRPQGLPDEKYGATYGKKMDSLHADDKSPLDKSLDPDAQAYISDLKAQLMSPALAELNTANRKTNLLILASTSGMNLEMEMPLGPHVGSYRNMLFKRALLMTRAPIVFFVNDVKFNRAAFDPNICFLVCGQDCDWRDIVKTQPIAVCVGSSREDHARKIVTDLMNIGLTLSSAAKPVGEYKDCRPFIVANDAFSAVFPGIRLELTNGRRLVE